ncbi:exonuclease domain-containing protein [Candidatus Annandia pinicola]|uniref:exonuclease domain-containing protein n=1 Tax=Candidatus Annandia pinicola TaxID=1345117 RepID=UPI001D00E758|nr:exonuclease domain-containing protein [Candidatus Annandia pinicola]UDG80359.1 Ribonuclease T [Candidatus Annandia pinicola]
MKIKNNKYLSYRFKEFYPIVIDVETSGLNSNYNSLLEISLITFKINNYGWLEKDQIIHFNIKPFINSKVNNKSIYYNKINFNSPLRGAISEYNVLNKSLNLILKKMKKNLCSRCIIIAHNVIFDYSFIMASIERSGLIINPFHPFTTFDTSTISSFVTGQNILSQVCIKTGLYFNIKKSHSALYDSFLTSSLFCKLINKFKFKKK